jgi:UDP-GlcNAc:undecaprenyl-phosphate GlcNAc-1-phosphate transferase
MHWPLLAFLFALGISYLATPQVRRLALRLNVMAHPGGRRVHTRPMPLWGGIAIFGAFAFTCLVVMRFGVDPTLKAPILGIVVAGALVLTVGLLDDMKEFSAAIQALLIVGAAIVLMTFGVRIQFLSNPFHPTMLVLPVIVSWLVTITWVFAITKTVDFMDGLDGLAAGIGAIAAGILAIMADYAVQPHVALMAAALSGACVGFLRFNFNPAKIFMGTGGSQFIGFALAGIAIVGAFKVAAAIAIVLPILVFGVPIFDAIFVVAKRFMDNRPVHVADQSHLHHRLLRRGLTHKQAVLVIYLFCLVAGGTALTLLVLSRR